MGAAALPAAMIATTLISTGYMVYSQNKAQKAAKEQQQAQAAKEDAAAKALADRGPQATMAEPIDLEEKKRARIEAMRKGLQSTIKTSPSGLLTKPNTAAPSAKTMLGQ
jgi:hypothetical protein